MADEPPCDVARLLPGAPIRPFGDPFRDVVQPKTAVAAVRRIAFFGGMCAAAMADAAVKFF